MSESKKEYSVVGTVTIGTDEYRDLLSEKFEAIKEKENLDRKNSEYYWKVRELEENNKTLQSKVDQLERYLKENEEQDSFELWILRSSRGE